MKIARRVGASWEAHIEAEHGGEGDCVRNLTGSVYICCTGECEWSDPPGYLERVRAEENRKSKGTAK